MDAFARQKQAFSWPKFTTRSGRKDEHIKSAVTLLFFFFWNNWPGRLSRPRICILSMDTGTYGLLVWMRYKLLMTQA